AVAPASPAPRPPSFTVAAQDFNPTRPKKRKVAHYVEGPSPMSNRKPFRLDLVAVALFITGLLLALSVCSRDPRDAEGQHAYPPAAPRRQRPRPARGRPRRRAAPGAGRGRVRGGGRLVRGDGTAVPAQELAPLVGAAGRLAGAAALRRRARRLPGRGA